MRRFLSPTAFVAVLALACTFAAARPARADDAATAPASPLARLTAEEQRIVRAKIAGFDALPLEKQEQVVRNVEWLRTAGPALREKVRRRVEKANEARLDGEKLDERVRDFGNLRTGQQRLAFHQGLVLGGLGRVAWRDLPAEIHDDPHARSVEQNFAVAFHRKFWGRAFRALDPQAALDFAVPADLPPELRERFTALRAQHARGDKSALGRLKEAVLQARAFEATRDLIAPPPVPPGGGPGVVTLADAAEKGRRLFALGERLRDLARPAYDETLAEFVAKWRTSTPPAWAEAVAKAAQPPEPPPELRRKIEALQAAIHLEALGAFIARHPALVGPADALLRVALVDELSMSAEEFARLPPRGEGSAQEPRSLALRGWIEQRSGLPRDVIRHAVQQALTNKRLPGAGGWFPARGKPPGSGSPPRAPGAPADEGKQKPSEGAK